MSNAVLKDRDYTLIIDRSASMGERDQPGGQSRWQAAQEGTEGLARKIQEFDTDGITLYTFNNTFNRYENVVDNQVRKVFTEEEPNGSTALAEVLEHALADYFNRKQRGQTKPNGEIVVVVTDGAPNDREKVAKVITAATHKMDRDEELGIQFVQIGNDQGATKFLQFLDDELVSQYKAKFDIVDTVTADQAASMTLSQVLERAITD